MSYLQAIPTDGKTDEQRYEEFITYMFQDGVIEKALEDDYDGEYNGLIQEKIAADLSPLGMVFDPDNKELSVARHRAMMIRNAINGEVHELCKNLDNNIKYDLSEEDLAKIKELELTSDEVEDEIIVRPFCLYEVDINKMYKKNLSDLPESAVEFAKLALNHEMDCAYEESEDEDEADDEEDDDDEESSSKGKGAAGAEEDNDEDEEEEEHVHGEHCNHGHDGFDLDDEDFPFEDEEVTTGSAETGLSLLKDHKAEVTSLLEKITGAKVDSFKTYSIPGRHYVVAWLKDFGIYGIRISYPMMMEDDDEFDEEEDDDEEAGSSSKQ
ncbi:hypothetical protein GGI07_004891 [Coemansia sp. Benny D115]|nr:hypothetical protein GGI07_004891 [Coemansia sp. Benny D115]